MHLEQSAQSNAASGPLRQSACPVPEESDCLTILQLALLCTGGPAAALDHLYGICARWRKVADGQTCLGACATAPAAAGAAGRQPGEGAAWEGARFAELLGRGGRGAAAAKAKLEEVLKSSGRFVKCGEDRRGRDIWCMR
jgi:hypothetical protein